MSKSAATALALLLSLAGYLYVSWSSHRADVAEAEALAPQPTESGSVAPAAVAARLDDRTPVPGGPAAIGSTGSAVSNHDLSPDGEHGLLAVSGTVRFSGDGEPAARARFVLHHPGGDVLVEADAEGRYRTAREVKPGVVQAWHLRSAEPGLYAHRLSFEPERSSLEPVDSGEARLDLVLVRPAATLVVEVSDLGGRLIEGAEVVLELRMERQSGEALERADAETTDARGRASFVLYDLGQLRAGCLLARYEERAANGAIRHLVSERTSLELPWEPSERERRVRLTVDASGALRVRVAEPNGTPVPDQALWLDDGTSWISAWSASVGRTDESGELLYPDLRPGEYTVGRLGEPRATGRKASVRAGETAALELIVAPLRELLAAAGRVVDESGAPLGGVEVHATFDPGASPSRGGATQVTGADGSFEFRALPCDALALSLDRDVFGDAYEPPSLTVAFGATGLVFRRSATFVRERLSFEVVDALSGERIPGALVITYRAPNLRDYSFHHAEDGLAAPLVALSPATTLVIEATGYRRATVPAAELRGNAAGGALRRVAMERGLLRELAILAPSGDGVLRPVAAARVRQGTRTLAISDRAGRVRLDLTEWPESGLVVEADGFAAATWLPADGRADLEPASVLLARE